MTRKRCVVLFARLPEKGRVKSRLSAVLDEAIVVGLYENFVVDLLDMLGKREFHVIVSCDPPEAEREFMAWLGEGSYMPQEGDDLGERMRNAFTHAFSQGFSEALLIGSDIPDLTGAVIEEAFLSLEGNDAVIGPATDGGYYLIGFRANTFLPALFDGIAWGTDSVFKETMRRFESSRYRVRLLPEWRDVDTADDLHSLYMRNRGTNFRNSRTMAYIAHNIQENRDSDGV